MNKFITEYTKQLLLAVQNHPEDYGYGVDRVPIVVEKMKDAIKNNSYNKDSRAFRATCKALGIKFTYTAINEYVKNE